MKIVAASTVAIPCYVGPCKCERFALSKQLFEEATTRNGIQPDELTERQDRAGFLRGQAAFSAFKLPIF